jgi:FtsH-binding integral membrane protein
MSRVTTTLEATRRRDSVHPWPPGVIVTGVVGWITTVLVLDSHSSHPEQRVLGVATWGVLAAVLRRESPLVRTQTAVVVGFASIVEFTFSPLLGVYDYRFHNVPMYVPPGHGLVYLGALAVGRTAFVSAHRRLCTSTVLVLLGGYAAHGLFASSRPDALGAFWFVCLVGFFVWGPSPGLYVGAALMVTYLELVGTRLGTWTWQPHDPTGLVSIGNPPSGAAGGYGWFDLAALLLAPALLSGLQRLSRGPRRPLPERSTRQHASRPRSPSR